MANRMAPAMANRMAKAMANRMARSDAFRAGGAHANETPVQHLDISYVAYGVCAGQSDLMANRMAPAMANRMAKPMRSLWQNDAPNPNPNPNPKSLGCFSLSRGGSQIQIVKAVEGQRFDGLDL